MTVASKDGGYFLSVIMDRPGRLGKYCFFMAVCSVDSVGDHSAAWWNATRSAGVLWLLGWTAALAVAPVARVSSSQATVHRPLARRVTAMGGMFGPWMVPPCLWRKMVHPASHSGPAASKDLSILGKMWAWVAAGGSPCSGRWECGSVGGLHGLVVSYSDSERAGGWADIGEVVGIWHVVASAAGVKDDGRGGAWLGGSLGDCC
jgi:hypothetical protein